MAVPKKLLPEVRKVIATYLTDDELTRLLIDLTGTVAYKNHPSFRDTIDRLREVLSAD